LGYSGSETEANAAGLNAFERFESCAQTFIFKSNGGFNIE
jgi:hypothetical protein